MRGKLLLHAKWFYPTSGGSIKWEPNIMHALVDRQERKTVNSCLVIQQPLRKCLISPIRPAAPCQSVDHGTRVQVRESLFDFVENR